MDFILTVTDDLGAEVYFGDLPLPLAVRAQCRVLDRWHPLPTAAFALKTEKELSPFIAGRGQAVEGRFTDELWRELRAIEVAQPGAPSGPGRPAEVRLHISVGERDGLGWRDAAPFSRFRPAPCRRLALALPPSASHHRRSRAGPRSAKRRKADDQPAQPTEVDVEDHEDKTEENDETEVEEEEKKTEEEEEEEGNGEEQYVVLPLLSCTMTVTRPPSNVKGRGKDVKSMRVGGASTTKAAGPPHALERSRTIEREVPLDDGSGRFISVREEYGTFLGSHLWDGALASSFLLCHINALFPAFLAGKRVLELGSGCGLMGLTAAMLGAHVTMTDLGEVVPTLRDNVERNIAEASSFASSSPSSSSSLSSSSSATRCGKVEARELDWTDDAALRRIGTETEWDLVVASDVMYSDTVFRLFFHALTTVLGLESAVGGSQPEGEARRRRQRRRAVQVVVGHKVRCEDERAYFETVRRVFDVVPIGRAFNTRVYLWQPRHG